MPAYPLQKKGHTPEFLREIAHLRPRSNLFGCVFRVRSRLAYAIHQFFQERGFAYVHTPIITGSDCEGAGELFRVTTLDLKNPPRREDGEIDFAKDFFARPTYLTVSGQLEAEAFACALSKVYTFGPTFRAENSNTSRHASEFWMIEPEMAFCDLQGDMELAEEFVKYLIRDVRTHCAADLELFAKFVDKGLIERLEFVRRAAIPAGQLHRGGRIARRRAATNSNIPSSTAPTSSRNTNASSRSSISNARRRSTTTRRRSSRSTCG